MRKIVDDVKDMSMCELADNCMFIKGEYERESCIGC